MAYKNKKGFTLVELLIVLVIFGMVTAMAAPSFSSMVERNSLAAESNRLIGNFRLARSEAVKRGELVTVAGVGTHWQQGFQIYANSDTNPGFDSTNDQIIRKESGLGEGIALAGNANNISFASNGTLDGANSVTLYLCRIADARRAIEITINRIGRAESNEVKDTANCAGDQS
ncbi:MAG: GspH/FimT family pseudopilin [Ketobacteraceae bacterium]|nr:GspH/FimT family pseudopilin [Ketobacteraceae bacterium]